MPDRAKEPLNQSARRALESSSPPAGCCGPRDRRRRAGRGWQRPSGGLEGQTLSGRAFAAPALAFGSLICNDPTTLAEAPPQPPAKAPSRPRRLVQSFPKRASERGARWGGWKRRYGRRARCGRAGNGSSATVAVMVWMESVGRLAQRLLRGARPVHPESSPRFGEPIPMRNLSTGEPDAGTPHGRFAGRGGRAPFPTPVGVSRFGVCGLV